MKNMGDYHNHYLKKDVLLLADVFEKFIDTCLKFCGLDPCHYFSSPGLSWDVMLKMNGEQWVGEMQNLSARSSFKNLRRSLIDTSKNSSLDCNFLFFFARINFRLRLIFVFVIFFVPRQCTISLV